MNKVLTTKYWQLASLKYNCILNGKVVIANHSKLVIVDLTWVGNHQPFKLVVNWILKLELLKSHYLRLSLHCNFTTIFPYIAWDPLCSMQIMMIWNIKCGVMYKHENKELLYNIFINCMKVGRDWLLEEYPIWSDVIIY